jgi:hypothetical protein
MTLKEDLHKKLLDLQIQELKCTYTVKADLEAITQLGKVIEYLKANDIVEQEDVFNYNMEFLLQALCVKKVTENDVVSYEILPGGKVVENFS